MICARSHSLVMTSYGSVLGLLLQSPRPHLWATGHAGAALTALPHRPLSDSHATPSTRPSSVLVPELILSAVTSDSLKSTMTK